MHLLARNEILDDMPAAVSEFSRVYLVQGIVFARFGGPDIAIHGCHSAVGRYIIEPHFGGLDSRLGVAEIDKRT